MNALRVTFTYVWISVPLTLTFALFLALILNEGLRGLSDLPGTAVPALAPGRQRGDRNRVGPGVRWPRDGQTSSSLVRHRRTPD